MGPTRSAILKILAASTASVALIILLLDLAATAVRSGRCDSSVAAPMAGAMELDFAFQELMSVGWLAAGDRAVFVGPDAMAAAWIARNLGILASISTSPTACCSLPFDGESFDFAFSAALDRARVPARVVLDMERVLRPGQVGAIFRLKPGSILGRPEGLMRAAAPVASLLRFSDVIAARIINGSVMIIFRKHLTAGGNFGGSTARSAGAGAGAGAGDQCNDGKLPIVTDAIEIARAIMMLGKGRFGFGIDIFKT